MGKIKQAIVVVSLDFELEKVLGLSTVPAPLFGDVSDVVAVRPGGELLLSAPKTGFTVTPGVLSA